MSALGWLTARPIKSRRYRCRRGHVSDMYLTIIHKDAAENRICMACLADWVNAEFGAMDLVQELEAEQ